MSPRGSLHNSQPRIAGPAAICNGGCNHTKRRLLRYESRLQPYAGRLQAHVSRLQPYSTCCGALRERSPSEARHTADDILDRRVGQGHGRLVLIEARSKGLGAHACSLGPRTRLQPPPRRVGCSLSLVLEEVWAYSIRDLGSQPGCMRAAARRSRRRRPQRVPQPTYYCLLPTATYYYSALLLPGR